ncbi:hypothetical protein Dimus_017996 [Dionaea muscipula]
MVMELSKNAPCFLSTELSGGDLSTGYLEDALIGFSIRFKRRRLASPSCYNSFGHNDDEDNAGIACVADKLCDSSLLSELVAAAAFQDIEKKAAECCLQEEAIVSTMAAAAAFESSSSSSVDSARTNCHDHGFFSKGTSSPQGKGAVAVMEKEATRVTACPFGLVKPGGIDGDVTLKDINKRILRPPTRRVRHPVGEYASRPWVSPDGPGLSGKAVVALTRIHTQGSGTITIIRTKS